MAPPLAPNAPPGGFAPRQPCHPQAGSRPRPPAVAASPGVQTRCRWASAGKVTPLRQVRPVRCSASTAAEWNAGRTRRMSSLPGGRMHAVRQQHEVGVTLPIDPQRGAGEPGVSDGRRARAPGRTTRTGSMVSHPRARELPGCATRVRTGEQPRACRGTRPRVPASAASQARANRPTAGSGAEQPGVSRDAAQRPAVVVVDLGRRATAGATRWCPWARCGGLQTGAGRT